MLHDPLDLPEQQITPPEIGRTECQDCQEDVWTETVVTCSNALCGKAICAYCAFTCEKCDEPLCHYCMTKVGMYLCDVGLCRKCQDASEMGEEDE